MRANRLPDEKEFKEGFRTLRREQPLWEIKELAIRTAEFLLDEPIRDRLVETAMLMGEGAHKLPYFPIRDLKINGKTPLNLEVDERNGIIYSNLPQNDYRLSYRIGFEPDQIPATIRELVLRIGRTILGEAEEDRTATIELTQVGRRIRAKAQEERDAYQVDREGTD